jgi:drug/metabolite transporter (DMT)-like permease
MFTSTLSANDEVFSNIQPMYGIFVLTGVSLLLLTAEHYQISGVWRKIIGWLMGLGVVISFIGASLWTFLYPSMGIAFWIYFIGLIFMGLSAILTIYSVKNAETIKILRDLHQE